MTYDPKSSFANDDVVKAHTTRGDELECVAFLSRYAGDGPALELAIGTGRIALPLAATGLDVHGIDFSPQMIAELKRQPGSDAITVIEDDLVYVDLPGPYSLVFIIWNSLFNVLDQDDQVRCFSNVAERLSDDGVFIVEGFCPGYLYSSGAGKHVETEAINTDRVRLGAYQHDPAEQRLINSHVTLTSEGAHIDTVHQRYIWPAEMDLMARLAGLRLEERWSGWEGEPFNSDSPRHISVYGRQANSN